MILKALLRAWKVDVEDNPEDEKMLDAPAFSNSTGSHEPTLIGGAIQFYSCFLSHSDRDQEFARRLYHRLRGAQLRTWYAPEDVQGGRKLSEQIDQAIRVYDKLLVILSEHSLSSRPMLEELRKARKAELRDNKRKLFPIRLVDLDTLEGWECFDLDTGEDLAIEIREYYIPDFSNWKNHDTFESALKRLLRDLQAADAPPIPAPHQPAASEEPLAPDDPLSPQAKRQHLRTLIAEKTRRLREREVQEAKLGVISDPIVLTEMADLRREIADLEEKLKHIA